jgi:hypothetical protein
MKSSSNDTVIMTHLTHPIPRRQQEEQSHHLLHQRRRATLGIMLYPMTIK